ncbi:MAG: hypothetical protein SPJ46_06470, partial [Sodaliphilus sp.]|nr:hypothetical protein [Sodaliphilus sp.]
LGSDLPHTDLTDPTVLPLWVVNLTDASRLLLKAYLIRFLHLFNPFKPYLHLIKINKKIGVNGFLMD